MLRNFLPIQAGKLAMVIEKALQTEPLRCQSCDSTAARRYHLYSIGKIGELHDEREFVYCVRCARNGRKRLQEEPVSPDEITREELIAELDRFFVESGASDICRRCHRQGTGCCPPTCRVMGEHGCDPNNKYGKTVFCSAFVCGALLNAISECDPEIGRTLKWIKQEIAPAEYHIYEMITRVPSVAREPVLPIQLPKKYPRPTCLENGTRIREKLALLVDEVLEIRRIWREREEDAGC